MRTGSTRRKKGCPRTRLALAVAVTLLAATACAGGSSDDAGEAGTPVVLTRAALAFAYPGFEVAQDQGYFEDEGLDAEIRSFDVGFKGLEAVMAGEATTAGTVGLPLLARQAQGADIVVPAVWFTAKSLSIVVRKGIDTPSDLRGTKIGLIDGSVMDYAFSRYLEKYELEGKVELVNVASADQVATLARGDIDGLVNLEPVISQVLEQVDGSHKLTPDTNEVHLHRAYLELDREWAENNRDTVEAILRGLIKANKFIEENPKQAAEITVAESDFSAEDVLRFWKEGDMSFEIHLDQAAYDSLEEVGQWMVDNGTLDSAPEAEDIIDPSYLKAIDPDLVKAG